MTTVRNVVEYRKAAQYNGSNSADLDEAITYASIASEVGGTLTLESAGSNYPVHTGDWVVWTAEGWIVAAFPTSVMDQVYKDLPTS